MLTAFITSEGLFAFRRMPFGLVNSGATFCRMMCKLPRFTAGREFCGWCNRTHRNMGLSYVNFADVTDKT